MTPPRAATARRRTAAAAACTALMLSLAPLGTVAAHAAPASTTPAVRTGLHVNGTRHVAGTKGTLDYDVVVPDFRGKGSTALDRRVTASVRAVVAATAEEDPGTAHHTLDGTGKVTRRDDRTVQVAVEYGDRFDGAAHPTDTVSTLVLHTRGGAPIRLRDVFPDRKKAYVVLAEQVERIAARRGEPVTQASGLAPEDANWSAWQMTSSGFQAHFQDHQLGGHGLRVYTVPWKHVKPLMSTTAQDLFAPQV